MPNNSKFTSPNRSQSQRSPGRPPKNRKKALDNLFPVSEGTQESSQLKMIEHKYLHVREQVRSQPETANISDLRESIMETRKRGQGIESSGLLQPLAVTPYDDYINEQGKAENGHYWVLAGHRRYYATEGFVDVVPCVVLPTPGSEGVTRWVQLTENVQREDLDIFDEARNIGALKVEFKLSQRDLAAMLGKDKGWVENRLNLLNSGSDVQEFLHLHRDKKGATLTNALIIDREKEPVLRARLMRAALDGATSKVLNIIINSHRQRDAATHAPAQPRPETRGRSLATDEQGIDEQGIVTASGVAFGQHATAAEAIEIAPSSVQTPHSHPPSDFLPPIYPQELEPEREIELDGGMELDGGIEQAEPEAGQEAGQTDVLEFFIKPSSAMLNEAVRHIHAGVQMPISRAQWTAVKTLIEKRIEEIDTLIE